VDEVTDAVQFGEEEAQGTPYHSTST